MISNFLNSLRQLGQSAYDAFAMPGRIVLDATATHAPGLAAFLNFDSEYSSTLPVFLLSLLTWFLVAVLLILLYRLFAAVLHQVGAVILTVFYRLSRYLRGLKTSFVLKLREWFPKRDEPEFEPPMIEFDKLDLAVLRSASDIGPGLALSAPDLAGRFKLRPSQVQRSLEKLSNNKMLQRVIGATDGYDNFSLTASGNTFLAMMQRQSAGS